ncbi:disease resistance protein Roq1-like [Rutidosis leptorrhynchoides]|uniref:disease resistance protein Roq1-like n=1 Tax=Rutidosis leptorrhynchoides TaxID=125765 RepID=UPI003A992999
MSASSISHQWKYDVFVSFRGEDIRKSFMDHLFKDFKQKGIHAFRDNKNLPRGEEISSQLCKAIEECRILIVIFSKGYASSSWCLRELVKILKCKKMENPKHEVRIIFYDVKPDVVRKQKQSYAEAFTKHEVLNSTEVVAEWKNALSMAADLSGWDLQDLTNGYESKLIDRIIKDILMITRHAPLHVGENIVGVDALVNKLNLWQFIGSSKVNMIGICGVSGIGKTTLVKAIYNSIYVHFDGSCFCDNIQGVSKRQGLTQFQLQLIADITKTKVVEISNVAQGIAVIKKKVSSKPILLVLDDVGHREHLEALAGSPNWFCPGSLIIVTSKDKQLLRSHRIYDIRDMDVLDDDESLQLLASYAFKEKHTASGFEELAEKVVKYVKGHPLALKVLGCFLYEKNVGEWVSELDRLELHPNEEIQRVLRVSYDGLNLHQQKILLDIACSFIGFKRDFVASVLDSCSFFADTNIRVLVDKSLITISSDMSLQMHDLIQAMARGIVCEESTFHGKQSRLWISSEIHDVMSGNEVTLTKSIEVLDLMLEISSQKVHINAKAFAQMKKMLILKIYHPVDSRKSFALTDFNVKFYGSLEFLSNELWLLYWFGFPFRFLPSSFYPENIVAIDLSYSNIQHLWTTPKWFLRLKVIKLRHCRMLTSTPDFTKITNLEELIFEGCIRLTKLHPSVGMLKRPVVLNMEDCKSLNSFPIKLEMESLKVLNLSGCLKMDSLPKSLSSIKTLVELHVNRTSITEVPSFVYSLRNLESLSFGEYERIPSTWWRLICLPIRLPSRQQLSRSLVWSSLAGLNLLKKLNLSNCNISEVPDSIGGLSHLTELRLCENSFTRLPTSLSQLSLLEHLFLHGCWNLEVVPKLPPHIIALNVDHCASLRELSELPPTTHTLYASGCTSLRKLPEQLNLGHLFFSCILMGFPKLFKNLTIQESQGSMSHRPLLVDSSLTSNGSRNQLFSLRHYLSLQIYKSDIFQAQGDHMFPDELNTLYHGNCIPKWFKNQSKKNHVKVDLPSDWCYDKVIGYATCVVFTPKKYFNSIGQYHRNIKYFVNNFDGALLYNNSLPWCPYQGREFIGKRKSDMIWFHYSVNNWGLKKAEKSVTFTFIETENENVEVKECGARFVYDEDIKKGIDLSMIQDIPTKDRGFFRLDRPMLIGKNVPVYHLSVQVKHNCGFCGTSILVTVSYNVIENGPTLSSPSVSTSSL